MVDGPAAVLLCDFAVGLRDVAEAALLSQRTVCQRVDSLPGKVDGNGFGLLIVSKIGTPLDFGCSARGAGRSLPEARSAEGDVGEDIEESEKAASWGDQIKNRGKFPQGGLWRVVQDCNTGG